MSRELTEFSELIDEQFDIDVVIDPDTFWEQLVNMFI
jgi:hypothetical protein